MERGEEKEEAQLKQIYGKIIGKSFPVEKELVCSGVGSCGGAGIKAQEI